jgi:hypothetical protein
MGGGHLHERGRYQYIHLVEAKSAGARGAIVSKLFLIVVVVLGVEPSGFA